MLLILTVASMLHGITAPYFYGNNYSYQDREVRASLSGELDTLILGSSQSLRGIMPSVLDEKLGVSSYNLASPLMTTHGRLMLLKKELERNPVKNVIIELSYNAMTLERSVLFEGDLYMLGRLDTAFERLSFFSDAFKSGEYRKVFSDALVRSETAWKNKLDGKTSRPFQYETHGYNPIGSNDQSVEDVQSILDTKKHETVFNESDLANIKEIIELCRENELNVAVIVTPNSERMLLEYSNFQDVSSQYAALAERYGCDYYDFNLDKLRTNLYSDATDFFDISHLSSSGAPVFTARLAEILSIAETGGDVSAQFFNNYSEARSEILKPQ